MTTEIPPLRWADGGLVSLPPLAPLDAGQSDGSVRDAAVRVDTDAATAPDAGTKPLDAGSADSPAPPRLPPSPAAAGGRASTQGAACGGVSTLGLCWYLGAAARSCNETCAAHGGFDARATGHVGTSRQGGSLQACARVMSALGHEGPRGPAMRDDFGLGCHVFSDDVTYWLDDPSPPFTADVTGAPEQVRIACACLR